MLPNYSSEPTCYRTRLNSGVMRLLLILCLTCLATGCINPTRMCGSDELSGWEYIREAPSNEAELLKLVEEEPLSLGQSRFARNYWFQNADAFMLCRADPQVASHGCFSGGWLIKRVEGSWQAENVWESVCTG